jgi:hypothetical protein
LKKFKLKALYSLRIAFYGFTPDETAHMREVTLENGGTPASSLNDPQCTHIVINDQEIKHMPFLNGTGTVGSEDSTTTTTTTITNINTATVTPTTTKTVAMTQPSHQSAVYVDLNTSPFSNTRALVVKAEWFWASIQICCRASECLYEFNSNVPTVNGGCGVAAAADANGGGGVGGQLPKSTIDPPTKRMKMSIENLLAPMGDLTDNSPHTHGRHSPDLMHHAKKKSANNLLATNLGALLVLISCSLRKLLF